jgi:hypothetical protein
MANKTIRVVTRASDGSLRCKDFENFENIEQLHEQIGIDDCSTDLSLRGLPVFRGLIGPISESKTVVRYESPEVFENLTKEWGQTKTKRRRRRKIESADRPASSTRAVPIPNMHVGNPTAITTPVSF